MSTFSRTWEDRAGSQPTRTSLENAIATQRHLLTTVNALLRLAAKAEKTWTRRSRSCVRLRQRCGDFATQFQESLGLTLANLIIDYVKIKDLRFLLIQLRDESERNTLILHGKLKQVNDELKRSSRVSLVEQSESSTVQPTRRSLLCHIKDVQILLATVRGSSFKPSEYETLDERALSDAAACLADSIDPYLPGCAVLLREGRSTMLEATLDSLVTNMESLLGSDTPSAFTKSPKRLTGTHSSLARAASKTLPNLIESDPAWSHLGAMEDDRASVQTLVVHDDDLKRTGSFIR